jgi:hypothetical protein
LRGKCSCVNGVGTIVPVRKGTRRGARRRGLAGLAVLGITVSAGLLAAWGVNPVEPKEIAPADVVALRFPADWMNSDDTTGTAEATAPTPAAFTLASVSDTPVDTALMFSPRQSYPAETPASAATSMSLPSTVAPVLSARLEPEPQTKADVQRGTKSESKLEPKPEPKTEPKTAAVPTRAIAAVAPQPPHKPAPRPHKDSGELFNEAQLASIKTRLRLSEYQQQYWPPVENALRAIGHAVAHSTPPKTTALGYASESRLAQQIDPDSAEVAQLKSAAFPLIMSMNEDQKQQVRNIAHVMGLERVASSF